MKYTIRTANDADIPAMAHIQTVLNPNYPYSAESFAREMQEAREHSLGLHEAYWVAELNDETVAYANVGQYAGLYHPDRYHTDVQVLPQGRSLGIGGALAETLRAHLLERGAREVLAGYYNNDIQASNMMKKYGLQEVQRYIDMHLDLAAFSWADWTEQQNLPTGVRMQSYAILQQELGERAALQAYFDVFTDTLGDVPASAERTLPTLEYFRDKRLTDQRFRAQYVMLAMSGAQAIAFSELWATETPDKLKIGFTCTRREHRRSGLALALKLAAMKCAYAGGIRQIVTNAESGNAPMLQLNDRLGFVRDVAYVEGKWGSVSITHD